MTPPCGHTADEHAQIIARYNAESRQSFTTWLHDTIRFDPSGWPDVLIQMADIMAVDVIDDVGRVWWTHCAESWSEETLVLLVGMSATAISLAHVSNAALLAEGERLGAMPASTMLHFAMARQLGDDGLNSPLATMLDNLTPWERFVSALFGSSALKTIGLGAADILALVETVTPPADLA